MIVGASNGIGHGLLSDWDYMVIFFVIGVKKAMTINKRNFVTFH